MVGLVNWLLVFSILPAQAAMGDVNAGKQKSSTCTACHGDDGISPNDLWPNLAGQKEQYVFKQLKQFHEGVRSDPLMSPVAKMLSEQDMRDLAAYFAQLGRVGDGK